MKKIIFFGLFCTIVLVGCAGKQSEEEVDSKDKISESVNSATTENVTHETTSESTASNESNYTLQVIRKMAESGEDLDTIILNLNDTPDEYKILAEPTYYEDTYEFISGPDNGKPVAYTENKEDTEKYNLSKNPESASIKDVKLLIEELKQERMQNE